MRKGALSDSDYGFQLYLKDDRTLPNGHTLTKLPNTSTDVELIGQIIDNYMNLSSDDTLKEFSDYKLDFSENYLDAFYLKYKEKVDEASRMLEEIDKQEADLSHRIIKPLLLGKGPLSDDKKVELFDELERLYIRRRWVKDIYQVAQVLMEHAEKSRNYVLGMNKRQYTPISKKYENNKDFAIPAMIGKN